MKASNVTRRPPAPRCFALAWARDRIHIARNSQKREMVPLSAAGPWSISRGLASTGGLLQILETSPIQRLLVRVAAE